MSWLLLIYRVPAEPSRKRAFVWRELKKVGAVYLRDGVCVLPDQAATRAGLRQVAERMLECVVDVIGGHLDREPNAV